MNVLMFVYLLKYNIFYLSSINDFPNPNKVQRVLPFSHKLSLFTFGKLFCFYFCLNLAIFRILSSVAITMTFRNKLGNFSNIEHQTFATSPSLDDYDLRNRKC